jgi:hypothetical protein
MPYLADKVLDMLYHILKKGNEGDMPDHLDDDDSIDFNKLLLVAGN